MVSRSFFDRGFRIRKTDLGEISFLTGRTSTSILKGRQTHPSLIDFKLDRHLPTGIPSTASLSYLSTVILLHVDSSVKHLNNNGHVYAHRYHFISRTDSGS